MRLLVTIGGGMLAMFLCEAMSKTIEYRYLGGDVSLASVQQHWFLCGILFAVLVGGIVFLYRLCDKPSLRWREGYFPSLGETVMWAVHLPLLSISLWSSITLAARYGKEARVPDTATWGFHGLTLLLTIAVTAVVVTLIRDLWLVRRVGWRQIEQMEAARVKEDGPIYPALAEKNV